MATIPMISGTTHMNGLMAGAARLGTCVPSHPVVVGAIAAAQIPAYLVVDEKKWGAWSEQPAVFPVFSTGFPVTTTDRPHPRLPERSP
jgi:hypothetical protein